MLDEKGSPAPVERARILPPASRIGPASGAERKAIIEASPLYGHHEKAVDRESAYEILKNRTAKETKTTIAGDPAGAVLGGGARGRGRETVGEAMMKSAARAIGSQIGRQI